jgi:hypothetical protein
MPISFTDRNPNPIIRDIAEAAAISLTSEGQIDELLTQPVAFYHEWIYFDLPL